MLWSGTIQEPVSAVPEGRYNATVTNVNELEATYGRVNKLEFMLRGDDDIEGRKVTGLTSTYIAENTKAGRWVAAIMGRVPTVGEQIQERDLLSKPCRVVVAHKTDSQGTVRANVIDVLPPSLEDDVDLPF